MPMSNILILHNKFLTSMAVPLVLFTGLYFAPVDGANVISEIDNILRTLRAFSLRCGTVYTMHVCFHSFWTPKLVVAMIAYGLSVVVVLMSSKVWDFSLTNIAESLVSPLMDITLMVS